MISTDSRKDMLLRTEPPPIKDPADFEVKLPMCEVKTLSNGVEVYLQNMGSEDTMMISWVFYAGNCYGKKKLVSSCNSASFKERHVAIECV